MDSSILVKEIYNPEWGSFHPRLLFLPCNNNRSPAWRGEFFLYELLFRPKTISRVKKRKQIMPIKVYVAEAEGIPEYGTTTTLGKRLVAVKFLLPEASEKEKWVWWSVPLFAFLVATASIELPLLSPPINILRSKEGKKEGRKERGYVISREIRFFHPAEPFFLEIDRFVSASKEGKIRLVFFFLRIYFIDRVIICKIYI